MRGVSIELQGCHAYGVTHLPMHCAGSFLGIKDALAPPARESSIVAAVSANIAQFMFPFMFTIIFSNFVISILVDTYLSKRSIAKSGDASTADHSGWGAQLSTLQVCSISQAMRLCQIRHLA